MKKKDKGQNTEIPVKPLCSGLTGKCRENWVDKASQSALFQFPLNFQPFVQNFGTGIGIEWCRNQAALHVTLFMCNTSNWKSLHVGAIFFSFLERKNCDHSGKRKKGRGNKLVLICRENIKASAILASRRKRVLFLWQLQTPTKLTWYNFNLRHIVNVIFIGPR